MSRRRLDQLSMGLVAACRLAIAAACLHWLATGNGLWAAVAAVALVLTFVPAAVVRDTLLRDATRAVVAVMLAAHVVLGMQGALYETSAAYDKWMHLLGSAAVAGLGIVATLRYCDGRRIELPLTLLALLVLTGTLSAGTLWELFEFTVDRTGLFTAQRGLDDTMLDLLANTIGAAVATSAFAASVSVRRLRRARRPRMAGPGNSANRTRSSRVRLWLAPLLATLYGAPASAAEPVVTLEGDSLSVTANGATIGNTLAAICHAAGCTLSVRGELNESSDLELQGLPLRDAIQRLLESGGHSSVLVYAPGSESADGRGRIDKVIALALTPGGGASVVVQTPYSGSPEETMSRAQIERELRQAQARGDEEGARFLTDILLMSMDAALRERAASALVALGELADACGYRPIAATHQGVP